ncbi:MAG: hypothetical protein P4L85_19140 [Paludisphaera borealis]|uniref:hypothetical protein n=1 Tax=Paludisphaera borealis TaxID=1387353 RepID=UPI002842C4DB|nr:hypothetical protein [Paludisphaera borealis]MDR3621474.1 hypothetical protein [Paludisphaera borealis]
MRRRLRPPVPIASAFVVAVAGAVLFGITTVRGDGAAGREIPPPFAPFEYLVGSWKGQGVSRDDPSQRFRGWPETHAWAWTFSGGKPIAMSVTFQGSKLLKAATLTFDAAKDRYQLKAEAVAPAGATIVYEGGLDASHKLLTLERAGVKSGEPAERLTLRANSNFIRYTLIADRKPAGRVQYAPAIEVGLTKEGETFAAGAQAAERRKCVVTGGAATLTVSFQGREFPICCTGCRDEFLETPDKYIKKASLASESAAKGMPAKPAPAPSRVRGADDAFAGDVEEPSAKPEKEKAKSKSMDKAEPDDDAPAPKSKPAAKPADRATGLLKIAQNLEKAGKPAAALKSYRELVKSFPDAPAAKTAKERIKALADQ